MAALLVETSDKRPSSHHVEIGQSSSGEYDHDVALDEDPGKHFAVIEDLSFMMFGDTEEKSQSNGLNIARIHWARNCNNPLCDDWQMEHESKEHLESSDGPPILFGQLKYGATVSRTKIMRLITLHVESGYHSSLNRTGDALNFGAHYNLRGDRNPEIRGETVDLTYRYQSLRFQYNLKSGRASYLLACTDDDFQYFATSLTDRKMPANIRPHPFSIHLILLFKSVFERNKELEETLRKLLYLENRSIFQQTKVTFEEADETKLRLQVLHSLFQDILIRDNNNKRHLATIDCLLRDLSRLMETVREDGTAFPIDDHDHQRVVDGFHCLKDFCLDRERRLKSRLQRVQNLIGLTYNLLANRDSIISHSIAHEARQDGAAMRTIALVTMLFFPATFVSSFLGTNLVTLDTSADGKTRLVFSELWWIYLISAVPLTLFTLLLWIFWIKKRARREKGKIRRAGETKV